jgi:hypothetical protein
MTFNNLRKLLDRFAPWAALGSVPNLDEYVASHATSAPAIEALFANLKAVLRDLQRTVPNDVKEECFVVDITPFKLAVERHADSARAALARSCYLSAIGDRDALADFARDGRALLALEATSLSELAEARVQVCAWRVIVTSTAACRSSADSESKHSLFHFKCYTR